MMNKKLLISLMILPLMAGCTLQKHYKPSIPYPNEELPAEETEYNQEVQFFYDFSHSDEPYFTMRWYALTPLGEVPKEAEEGMKCQDSLFPTFLGFSQYSSCMDESHLWNFGNDMYEQNILKLYGVWVAE